MKTLSIIIFVVSANLNSFCQPNELPVLPIDSLTGKITYADIIYLDSTITKQKLFSNAQEWFTKSFKYSPDILKMDDKNEGILVAKGTTQKYFPTNRPLEAGSFQFNVSLYIKDGRYKYEITDFIFTGGIMRNITGEFFYNRKGPIKFSKKVTMKHCNKLNEEINNLVNNLKSTMSDTKTSNKSDW